LFCKIEKIDVGSKEENDDEEGTDSETAKACKSKDTSDKTR
jgi:hypothetical protein